MALLTVRQLFERAANLDKSKLDRLLEDLPLNMLVKLENFAVREQLNNRDSEVCQKIINASSRRIK